MESVYIKQVPTCEVNKLVYFINMHWKHNHSLAVSRELLNFQHLDKDKAVSYTHLTLPTNREV